MKFLLITLFVISTFIYPKKLSVKNICDRNIGIKTAKISAKILTDNKSQLNTSREITFNKDGQVILIKNFNKTSTEHKRVYLNSKLNLIITKQKSLPDFYDSSKLDSLIENAKYKIDTTFVKSHFNDGRPNTMKTYNGLTITYEYENCNKTLETYLDNDKDTIQQYISIYKNNVLSKTIWTLYNPIKSSRTSNYYDYKFNEQGDWIERSYNHENGPTITETRVLTYH